MDGSRRAMRQAAFQAIYLMDVQGLEAQPAIDQVLALASDGQTTAPAYVDQLVVGVSDQLDGLDGLIDRHLDRWTVNRLDRVDACILRLGAYELTQVADVPDQVVIDEMIELAKAFSNESSAKLVNAVLDAIAKDK